MSLDAALALRTSLVALRATEQRSVVSLISEVQHKPQGQRTTENDTGKNGGGER